MLVNTYLYSVIKTNVMSKKFIPNISIINRGYKNTSKSETININKVSKPFRVVDGKIVERESK